MGEKRLLKIRPDRGGMALEITDEPEPLFVSVEVATRRRLAEGTVVTPAQMEQLRGESQSFLCERKAGDLLAYRDHSEGELAGKLRRRGFQTEAIKSALEKYRQMGALDDARFAHTVASSLLDHRPCGKPYLIAFLQRKRISRDLAEQTAEMLLGATDDHTRAVAALESRWSRISQFALETARQKAYNYLSRRGFGYGAAKTAFDQLWQSED